MTHYHQCANCEIIWECKRKLPRFDEMKCRQQRNSMCGTCYILLVMPDMMLRYEDQIDYSFKFIDKLL